MSCENIVNVGDDCGFKLGVCRKIQKCDDNKIYVCSEGYYYNEENKKCQKIMN